MTDDNYGDPERITIPLVMLPGNMEILLNNVVPCKGISLVRSEEYVEAVVLTITGLDPVACEELGFKTSKPHHPLPGSEE